MATIKIGELKEALKLNNKESIRTVEYNGLQIELKQHIPILEKIKLVSSIYESGVNRSDGLHIINGNSVDIGFKVYLVQTYTNLTLPQAKNDEGKMETDMIGSYDMLVSSGLYDFIYENIPENEILDVQMALNNHIQAKQDEYEQKNTITYIIKNMLNELIGKLPSLDEAKEFIASASKEIEGFDPNKMEFVKDFLAKTSGENDERN